MVAIKRCLGHEMKELMIDWMLEVETEKCILILWFLHLQRDHRSKKWVEEAMGCTLDMWILKCLMPIQMEVPNRHLAYMNLELQREDWAVGVDLGGIRT